MRPCGLLIYFLESRAVFSNIDPLTRERWQELRQFLEKKLDKTQRRTSVIGDQPLCKNNFGRLAKIVTKLLGLYTIGRRNAFNFEITNVDFHFSDLPPVFDGYRILQLSDLHVGNIEDLPRMIGNRLSSLSPDLVVMTGDYQTYGTPTSSETADLIRHLKSKLNSRDGWIAVLGNHDRHNMLEALESIDVRVLVNETMSIFREEIPLHFVGTDDVHSFYSPDAIKVLKSNSEGFRIALVHTPELATEAAASGIKLYLTGHTHGGQICLPGGRPILTELDSHHHLASGKWELESMKGYTNRGLGHGLPPIRFNCPGEASLIRLKRITPSI
jgi:uncharacterized protein